MILDRIAADTKLRVNKEKRKVPFSQMRAMAYKKEKNSTLFHCFLFLGDKSTTPFSR